MLPSASDLGSAFGKQNTTACLYVLHVMYVYMLRGNRNHALSCACGGIALTETRGLIFNWGPKTLDEPTELRH